MPQTTRETLIDLLLKHSETKKKIKDITCDDPFASNVYKEEKLHLLIENYIDGALNEKQRSKFEKILLNNQTVKKEFELRHKINQFIKETDIKLYEALELAYQENEFKKDQSIVPDNVRRININKTPIAAKWIAAASILLIMSLSVYSIFNNDGSVSNELYITYYAPISTDKAQMFVLNSTALYEARNKYFNREYKEALIAFNNLPTSLNIGTEKDFFLGLSFMELGSYEEAIEKFLVVQENEKFEYLPFTKWYLGLCYLKTGQTEKAKEIFIYIARVNSFNGEKASKILKKLK